MAQKLILDCDTGTDDAVAIMLAALHPGLELLGVTTVNGNVEVARCTDNSLRTLDWIGRGEIPVYEGLAKPIVRDDFPVPRAINRNPGVHMEILPLPEARQTKQAQSAPEFLVRADSFALVPPRCAERRCNQRTLRLRGRESRRDLQTFLPFQNAFTRGHEDSHAQIRNE